MIENRCQDNKKQFLIKHNEEFEKTIVDLFKILVFTNLMALVEEFLAKRLLL
jgi:hypothetical protein